MTTLQAEIEFFHAHRDEWLKTNAGRFVVIHGSELVGFTDTEAEAMVLSAHTLGLNSALIRRVNQSETRVSIPALSLGLLSADTLVSA